MVKRVLKEKRIECDTWVARDADVGRGVVARDEINLCAEKEKKEKG